MKKRKTLFIAFLSILSIKAKTDKQPFGFNLHGNMYIPLDDDALEFVVGGQVASGSYLSDIIASFAGGIRFYDEDISASAILSLPLLGNKLEGSAQEYLRHICLSLHVVWELADIPNLMVGVQANIALSGISFGVIVSKKINRYEIGGSLYYIKELEFWKNKENNSSTKSNSSTTTIINNSSNTTDDGRKGFSYINEEVNNFFETFVPDDVDENSYKKAFNLLSEFVYDSGTLDTPEDISALLSSNQETNEESDTDTTLGLDESLHETFENDLNKNYPLMIRYLFLKDEFLKELEENNLDEIYISSPKIFDLKLAVCACENVFESDSKDWFKLLEDLNLMNLPKNRINRNLKALIVNKIENLHCFKGLEKKIIAIVNNDIYFQTKLDDIMYKDDFFMGIYPECRKQVLQDYIENRSNQQKTVEDCFTSDLTVDTLKNSHPDLFEVDDICNFKNNKKHQFKPFVYWKNFIESLRKFSEEESEDQNGLSDEDDNNLSNEPENDIRQEQNDIRVGLDPKNLESEDEDAQATISPEATTEAAVGEDSTTPEGEEVQTEEAQATVSSEPNTEAALLEDEATPEGEQVQAEEAQATVSPEPTKEAAIGEDSTTPEGEEAQSEEAQNKPKKKNKPFKKDKIKEWIIENNSINSINIEEAKESLKKDFDESIFNLLSQQYLTEVKEIIKAILNGQEKEIKSSFFTEKELKSLKEHIKSDLESLKNGNVAYALACRELNDFIKRKQNSDYSCFFKKALFQLEDDGLLKNQKIEEKIIIQNFDPEKSLPKNSEYIYEKIQEEKFYHVYSEENILTILKNLGPKIDYESVNKEIQKMQGDLKEYDEQIKGIEESEQTEESKGRLQKLKKNQKKELSAISEFLSELEDLNEELLKKSENTKQQQEQQVNLADFANELKKICSQVQAPTKLHTSSQKEWARDMANALRSIHTNLNGFAEALRSIQIDSSETTAEEDTPYVDLNQMAKDLSGISSQDQEKQSKKTEEQHNHTLSKMHKELKSISVSIKTTEMPKLTVGNLYKDSFNAFMKKICNEEKNCVSGFKESLKKNNDDYSLKVLKQINEKRKIDEVLLECKKLQFETNNSQQESTINQLIDLLNKDQKKGLPSINEKFESAIKMLSFYDVFALWSFCDQEFLNLIKQALKSKTVKVKKVGSKEFFELQHLDTKNFYNITCKIKLLEQIVEACQILISKKQKNPVKTLTCFYKLNIESKKLIMKKLMLKQQGTDSQDDLAVINNDLKETRLPLNKTHNATNITKEASEIGDQEKITKNTTQNPEEAKKNGTIKVYPVEKNYKNKKQKNT
ncbi:hypothetical protein [Alphaproteobacteria bacterium endosymbiont of Tiliacea citrago]|uniref:hypothetical protein n=1 Tax=Alphaproteobacteria bacterium endosymbiont of Tiliacea citrago TaxID=3077944 RepID=UPI00313B329D